MINVISKTITFKDSNNPVLKLKGFEYRLEIYNTMINVIIGDEQVGKYAKHFNRGKIYALHSRWFLDDSRTSVMFFSDKAIKDLSMIAHECTHSADVILDGIGYDRQVVADECNAYLVGHLFNVVLKAKKQYFK